MTSKNLTEITRILVIPCMKRGRKAKDLAGKTFGEWSVIGISDKRVGGHVCWVCVCSCGRQLEVAGSQLSNGTSTRCRFCSNKSTYAVRKAAGTNPSGQPTHGQATLGRVTPEYRAYTSAKQRCTNPKRESWPLYGGRGIKFAFTSFEQFFAEVGPKPEPKHMYSIDRIDNDGNYEPGNVQWATARDQRLNQRIGCLKSFKYLREAA